MISNLSDIIQNIIDLLELKKERLRRAYEDAEILKQEIIELEQAKIKLGSNEIHLITDNSKSIEIKSEFKPKSKDVLKYILENGPVSAKDIKNYFKCNNDNITCLGYMLQSGKIIKNGVSNNGFAMYSINNKLKASNE